MFQRQNLIRGQTILGNLSHDTDCRCWWTWAVNQADQHAFSFKEFVAWWVNMKILYWFLHNCASNVKIYGILDFWKTYSLCNQIRWQIVEGMFEPTTSGNAQGVQMLGLYVIGGVGKTMICKALCNHFQYRFQGRVCHVVIGPHEKHLDLQKKVLKTLTHLGNHALLDITPDDPYVDPTILIMFSSLQNPSD